MGKRRKRAISLRNYHEPENGPALVRRTHEVEEFAEGSVGSARRYRNVGEHPLTLAYARAKLGCDAGHYPRPKSDCKGCARFGAGEEYRNLFEISIGTGKDSTQPRIGGAMRPELSDSQEIADIRLSEIDAQMSRRNRKIVLHFCGMAESARSALTSAGVPFADQGVFLRLQEALDELVEAIGTKQRRRAA